MILQYTCNAFIRDGTSESTIPDDPTLDLFDQKYGRHESYSWYQSCKARSRNRGLFISDRQLNGNGAVYTRQNNNGNRHGYECPEERDYYPYWHPSPWKDIAILTDNTDRCASYQTESQNVKERYYCSPDAGWQATMLENGQTGFIPITQIECEALSPPGVWTRVDAWGIPAPKCLGNTWTRDNHLGTPWYDFESNLNSTTTSNFDWRLPLKTEDPAIFQADPQTGELASEHCVFRLRYNMSGLEFDFMQNAGQSWPQAMTDTAGFGSSTSAVGSQVDYHQNAPHPQRSPAKVDVWSLYRIAQASVQDNLDDNYDDRTTDERIAFVKTKSNIRGYVLEGNNQNPWVDIFGSLLPAGKHMYHQLAVDTSQFGRTFQDRSHMFSIRERPAALQSAVIHNFAVRGARGNNQQNYPRTEYEFTPERRTINRGDMIHFQWNGANTNNQGNAGQGTAGTDRSNVIALVQKYQNPDPTTYSTDINSNQWIGNFLTNYPSRIDAFSDSVNAPFLGYPYDDLRALALYGIYNPYFDLGPRQVTRSGTWQYQSTRNNNFTNRSQKGRIIVNAAATVPDIQWGPNFNKPYTASGDSWLLVDTYKFPISADVYLKGWGKDSYYDSEWAQLLPIRFSVTPGSYQMMAMKFDYYPFLAPHVYWATNLEGQMMTEVSVSGVYTNVVEFKVTAGGFYVVKNQPDPGMIAGVLVAVIVVFGGGGYACYRYKKGFNKKPVSTTGADQPLNTRGNTSETTTGVEI